MTCEFKKYRLHFRKPGRTSRGVLYDKDTYFMMLSDGKKIAYGECNLFPRLSYDDRPDYEMKLSEVCERLPSEGGKIIEELVEWPSIRFGAETVLRDWNSGCRKAIFPEILGNSGFSVPINGLIWMGEKDEMKDQITAKLKEGYQSVKLKIGAIDFDSELELLEYIRKQFDQRDVELRLDANGAFGFDEAREKLNQLSKFGIHYIEQPIKAGHWQEMAALVEASPIKIALDEELIGVNDQAQKLALIQTISPQVLILKPALTGGFLACDEWKDLIEHQGGEWVITSALESNVGLNAIAQYAATKSLTTAQGLGTGQLFTNNFLSPYSVDSRGLHYHRDGHWDLSLLHEF